MRQRAALLRTLLYDSEVILLDEPFGALDAQTRAHMQQWLLQIWVDFRKTVVFITHDVDEAVYLSDEIFVMSARPGRIKERIEYRFPRPRSPEIIHDGAFGEIKRRCLDLLGHDEIVRNPGFRRPQPPVDGVSRTLSEMVEHARATP